jgi:ATP adenylyltransferase
VALEHLWATWRSDYVRGVGDGRTEPPGGGSDDGRSLLERILGSGEPDGRTHIVRRGPTCFVILNRFPYTAGHLMVLPNRAVPDLELLSAEEHDELWATVRDSVVALKAALACDAVNVGINLGAAAGGSQADHLHVHCVPRWVGDANFMTVAGQTRVLPVSLDEAWERLRAAWPASAAEAGRGTVDVDG